jgi:carbonic anhydrase
LPHRHSCRDLTRIRNHPLVPGAIPIYVCIYDVTNGELVEVPEVSATGQAR